MIEAPPKKRVHFDNTTPKAPISRLTETMGTSSDCSCSMCLRNKPLLVPEPLLPTTPSTGNLPDADDHIPTPSIDIPSVPGAPKSQYEADFQELQTCLAAVTEIVGRLSESRSNGEKQRLTAQISILEDKVRQQVQEKTDIQKEIAELKRQTVGLSKTLNFQAIEMAKNTRVPKRASTSAMSHPASPSKRKADDPSGSFVLGDDTSTNFAEENATDHYVLDPDTPTFPKKRRRPSVPKKSCLCVIPVDNSKKVVGPLLGCTAANQSCSLKTQQRKFVRGRLATTKKRQVELLKLCSTVRTALDSRWELVKDKPIEFPAEHKQLRNARQVMVQLALAVTTARTPKGVAISDPSIEFTEEELVTLGRQPEVGDDDDDKDDGGSGLRRKGSNSIAGPSILAVGRGKEEG